MRIRLGLATALLFLSGHPQEIALARAFPEFEPSGLQVHSETEHWPHHLGDAQRRGAVKFGPKPPLKLQWLHQEDSAPQPGWDRPANQSYWQGLNHLQARVQFDHVFAPVISDGKLYFGSSADGGVRCLETESGQLLWTFFAEAPVRLSPSLSNGRVYFGADDGFVYCLQGSSGQLLWRTLLPPSDRRIPSNGKLLSAWPVRTGTVVDGQTLYATCGIFPNYGCWAAALDAENGSVIWKQKLADGLSPQGYLLLSKSRLYIPNGRTTPFALSRADGSYIGRFGGAGGAYALLTEPTETGELISGPGNQGELTLAAAGSQERIASFAGRRMVVGPRMSFLQSATQIVAVDRKRLVRAQEKLKSLAEGDLKGRAEAEKERATSSIWSIACTHNDAMVLSGKILWAAGSGEIAAYSAKDGSLLWSFPVPEHGQILDLAIAGSQVFASTSLGTLLAFGTSSGKTELAALTPPIQSAYKSPQALVLHLNVTARSKTAEDVLIVAASKTHPDLLRPASQVLPHDALVRISNQIADQVVLHGVQAQGSTLNSLKEYSRLLRPGGELIWFEKHQQQELRRSERLPRPLANDGTWSHPYSDAGNTACSGGTLDTADLELLWFGGPGAQPMIDRHLRTTPPVADQENLYIPGNDQLIAMNLFNGSVRWRKDLPGWTRVGIPYDAGYTFALAGEWFSALPNGESVALNAETGEQSRSFQLPSADYLDEIKEKLDWGWLAADGGMLLGSGMTVGAARRQQSREDVVEHYREQRPLVCSRLLVGFALARCTKDENQSDWWYESPGIIPNPTLTAGDGKVFFLESTSSTAVKKTGRATLQNFFADGTQEFICLSSQTGAELWRVPYEDLAERHVIYACYLNDRVVTVGSFNREQSVWYSVRVWDASTGAELWRAEHANNRPGIGGDHGEQVHHPVVQGSRLIVEPAIYELRTGVRLDMATDKKSLGIPRRGGCGTLSASANALFYRDSCPTAHEFSPSDGVGVLDSVTLPLTSSTRPGCWINILPVAGLILIPEASSGCVCAYPVQTSLALRPRKAN